MLFVVVNESEVPVFQKHYSYKEKKVALHIVNENQLKEWLLLGYESESCQLDSKWQGII